MVKRSDDVRGFKVLPHRWLMHQRRLVRDYERTISIAVKFIYIALIRLQLRSLA